MNLLNYLLSLSDVFIAIAFGLSIGWMIGHLKDRLQ